MLWILLTTYLGLLTALQWSLAILSWRQLRKEGEVMSIPFRHSGTEPLAIVVPCRDEADSITGLLEDLAAQTIAGRLQIIVVDDGSADETARVSEEWAALTCSDLNVLVLRCARLGKGAAIDEALKRVTTSCVALLDADVRLSPMVMEKLDWSLHQYEATVGVSGLVVARTPKGASRMGRLLGTLQNLEYMRVIIWRPGWQRLRGLSIIEGRVGLFRTDLLRKAKPFSQYAAAVDYNLSISMLRQARLINPATEFRLVIQAVAESEVPVSWGTLARQRGRWLRGLVRAYWTNLRVVWEEDMGATISLEYLVRIFTTPHPVVETLFMVFLLAVLLSQSRQMVVLFAITATVNLLSTMLQMIFAVWLTKIFVPVEKPGIQTWLLIPIFAVLWEPYRMVAALWGACLPSTLANQGWTPSRISSRSSRRLG